MDELPCLSVKSPTHADSVGHEVKIERMASTWWFVGVVDAAEGIRRALTVGNTNAADRFLTEATSRILLAPVDSEIPPDALAEPPSTGDQPYDTLLATALAFALSQRGAEVPEWMVSRPALTNEWLWDGGYDAEGPFKDFIRARTPDIFLAKNLLLRERDLVAP